MASQTRCKNKRKLTFIVEKGNRENSGEGARSFGIREMWGGASWGFGLVHMSSGEGISGVGGRSCQKKAGSGNAPPGRYTAG